MGRSCSICNDVVQGPGAYTCNYCAGTFCAGHRLPENHNCPGIEGANSLGPDLRGVETGDDPVQIGASGPDQDEANLTPCEDCGRPSPASQDYCNPCRKDRINRDYTATREDIAAHRANDKDRAADDDSEWIDRERAARASRRVVMVGAGTMLVGGVARYWDDISGAIPSELPDLGADSGLDELAAERRVAELINQEREARDLGPLGWRPDLQTVANDHSRDMIERSYFAHESPDGDTMSDRYDRHGIDCGARGENIAQTWWDRRIETSRGTTSFDTADELAQGLVLQWMTSPPHRENLLDPSWTGQGIGIEVSASEEVLATQNFCGPPQRL